MVPRSEGFLSGKTGVKMKKIFRSEKDVKDAVKIILKKYKAWYFMPVTGGYGKSGVPDFACVYKGHPIFIETKFGYNKPTPLQKLEMEKLYNSGAIVFVINENSVSVVDDLLLSLSMDATNIVMCSSFDNLRENGMFKETDTKCGQEIN